MKKGWKQIRQPELHPLGALLCKHQVRVRMQVKPLLLQAVLCIMFGKLNGDLHIVHPSFVSKLKCVKIRHWKYMQEFIYLQWGTKSLLLKQRRRAKNINLVSFWLASPHFGQVCCYCYFFLLHFILNKYALKYTLQMSNLCYSPTTSMRVLICTFIQRPHAANICLLIAPISSTLELL